MKIDSKIRKQKAKNGIEIMEKIWELEKKHKYTVLKDTLKELTALRSQLRNWHFKNVGKIIMRNKKSFYKFGNKNS